MAEQKQATEIIDSVTRLVDAVQPDTINQVQPEPNYWWLLLIGVVPVVVGWLLHREWRKRKR